MPGQTQLPSAVAHPCAQVELTQLKDSYATAVAAKHFLKKQLETKLINTQVGPT